MLSEGKHIQQKDDLLTALDPETLHARIRRPDEAMRTLIARLRLVRTLDPKQYAVMKRELPYAVCAIFDPPYRRVENFGYAEHFIIDIDHIGEKGLDIDDLRTRLCTDPRVMLLFLSPGEDGLKVLFRLDGRCHDAGRYSLFYKAFARSLSAEYGFEQVVDTRTSDVSRACFLSYDPDAFFRPDAEPVSMKAFVDFDNPFAVGEQIRQMKAEDDAHTRTAASLPKEERPVPSGEAIEFIKRRLQLKSRAPRSKPQVYVPEQLDEVLEKLLRYIGESGVRTANVENISYGKKFTFQAGGATAEINLFFGKKGFSVVKSPKQGTSDQLNTLMQSYLQAFIDDYVLIHPAPTDSSDSTPSSVGGQLRREAEVLQAGHQYKDAATLFRKLWEGCPDERTAWDGWRYAFCLKQEKCYVEALDICREVYRIDPDFVPARELYAWCVYYTEIVPEPVCHEPTFLRAATAIMRLTSQEAPHSAYTVTVFKVLSYLSSRSSYPTEAMLEWTDRLRPERLGTSVFSFTDPKGKQREVASELERYYMYRAKALLEKGEWDPCIALSTEALAKLTAFHYDNDAWFRWRVALAHRGKGEDDVALKLLKSLLSRKRDWFIEKEIADILYRQGIIGEALTHARRAAAQPGDPSMRGALYQLLADILGKLGQTDEAKRYAHLVHLLRVSPNADRDNRLREALGSVRSQPSVTQLSGVVHSILPTGNAGFIKADNGRTYFFRLRDFRVKSEEAVPGLRVTFDLTKGFDKKKNQASDNAINVTMQ
ncbi:MAG: hypothetical protein LBN29_05640 [Mediterranea sp.]|jgi:tetratricopeptide (TPR) repeat protein/cold shock CspA family protein|nr:hypothetical protein [Mediterranea sp.]